MYRYLQGIRETYSRFKSSSQKENGDVTTAGSKSSSYSYINTNNKEELLDICIDTIVVLLHLKKIICRNWWQVSIQLWFSPSEEINLPYQSRSKLFYGRAAEWKYWPPWFDWWEKIENFIGENTLKQSQKRNLDQKLNDSKPHFWSLSMNFRFFGRKSKSQQKLAKKITHFAI